MVDMFAKAVVYWYRKMCCFSVWRRALLKIFDYLFATTAPHNSCMQLMANSWLSAELAHNMFTSDMICLLCLLYTIAAQLYPNSTKISSPFTHSLPFIHSLVYHFSLPFTIQCARKTPIASASARVSVLFGLTLLIDSVILC